MERVETRVVFPAPWMPLRPIVKSFVGLVVVLVVWEEEERCVERCERMNGMQ